MGQARCLLTVRGLDCPTEAATLRSALEGMPGVAGLGFDLIHGMMTVDYDPSALDPASIVSRVASRAGMRASLVSQPSNDPTSWWARHERWTTTIVAGIGLLFGFVLDWLGAPAAGVRAAYIVAIVAGGVALVPGAFRALRRRQLDMYVLMTVAILGAAGLGQWDEAATVAFLFGLSEALEGLSLDRARRAVRALLEVTPDRAEVLQTDGTVRDIPAQEVQAGDRVRVRAGAKMPVDGVVVSGRSSVDQKSITGESIPILREPGDEVFAGTVNGDGALEIRASRPLDDALITRLVERVRAAQSSRAPSERTIERFARIYTPAVVIFAGLIMFVPPLLLRLAGEPANLSEWFLRGLVVLVIACPCALVIGTPVAVVCGLTAAARRGILIKGGQFLEMFGRLRILAFDKTGTLTSGEPDVVEVVPVAGGDSAEVLRIAAALGDRGGHVLGRAIARHARDLRLDVPEARDYQAVPGLGASGQVDSTEYHMGSHRYIDENGLCGDSLHGSLEAAEDTAGTAVALTTTNRPLGWIRLEDRPRAEAAQVLRELHQLGIETIMLTGDNPSTAAAIAREVGIGEHRSSMLPSDKATAVSDLDTRRGPTGMVGDGVNDAPALAAARVSVALGGISSGAALETADIVLMADDLTGLPWLVRHSRHTLARIRQNIALAIVVKLLVMALAVIGWANLWMAIAADLGVSLIVVANALRLLGYRPRKKSREALAPAMTN